MATIIDLSGVDLDSLTVDNFRDVTKLAGKNPDKNGVPRGYRLRLPKHLARRVRNTNTNDKIGTDGDILTHDEARQLRLVEIVEEFRASQNTVSESVTANV